MFSVTFSKFGPPSVLQLSTLPVPKPGRGEIVVRVSASTINPTDLMMRSGAQAKLMEHLAPPYVPGMEFSGHVHEAGDGVDLAPGTPVIGLVNPRRPEGGAHAEYVRVPAASAAPISNSTDLIGAATVPMNSLTAWMALELVELKPGQTVLITGGTGMFGGFAIQLAHHAGVRVVANGPEKDTGLLRQLGADLIVPRDTGLIDAVRSEYPNGVDALIDGALIGSQISSVVRDGGVAVSLRMSHPITDARLRTPHVSVTSGMERTDIITEIARLLDGGVLRPHVAEGGRYAFRDAVDAHTRAEAGGFRGGVILDFTAT
jgi:NADPH2:quinone reductase